MTEHTDETPTETPEPTAEERRAQLPGLGYSGKFDHGDQAAEDSPASEEATEEEPVEAPVEDDGTEPEPAPPSSTVTAPPPAAQPWTLSQGGE